VIFFKKYKLYQFICTTRAQDTCPNQKGQGQSMAAGHQQPIVVKLFVSGLRHVLLPHDVGVILLLLMTLSSSSSSSRGPSSSRQAPPLRPRLLPPVAHDRGGATAASPHRQPNPPPPIHFLYGWWQLTLTDNSKP
jgi:hypothetical protein